jgi:hypothetical protein
VMAIGGFNGSDPSPTLGQFQQYVRESRVHYFLGGDLMREDSGGSTSQQISAWVEKSFRSTTLDGVTLYDLTRPVTTVTT